MKREILFRGKRIDNGEWVEGSLINNAFMFSETKKFVPYIFSLESESDCWEDMNDDDYKEVNPETVGQFTGLTDKTGNKKIFEGDIITATRNLCSPSFDFETVEEKESVIGVVKYKYDGFYIFYNYCGFDKIYADYFDEDTVEVIGNIKPIP